jgi:phospholipid/cholesterol/gamma-HCH transport system substrate-binding protein
MSKPRLEWRVGLFVLIGLVLLTGLMVQFSKGTTFFRKTYNIMLHAANVGGLKPRATVLMAGVQVGTVSEIRLGTLGTNVTITLRIFRQYQIHKDARFVLEQAGFLGDQYVAIIPTRNEDGLFADGDPAQAEAPFNLQEVARAAAGFLIRIDETASRVNDIITNLSQALFNERTLTNLAATANNLREVSENALATVNDINRIVGTNELAFSQSGSNLLAFTRRLNDVASGLGDVVATNSPAVNGAVKNIEDSTKVLKDLADRVKSGQGLAGNVLMNEQLADTVSQIANNLSITSSNLNRLGLWGILWQHKPPKKSPGEGTGPASAGSGTAAPRVSSPKGTSQ